MKKIMIAVVVALFATAMTVQANGPRGGYVHGSSSRIVISGGVGFGVAAGLGPVVIGGHINQPICREQVRVIEWPVFRESVRLIAPARTIERYDLNYNNYNSGYVQVGNRLIQPGFAQGGFVQRVEFVETAPLIQQTIVRRPAQVQQEILVIDEEPLPPKIIHQKAPAKVPEPAPAPQPEAPAPCPEPRQGDTVFGR